MPPRLERLSAGGFSLGVQSVLMPYVQTEDEARSAAAFTRYPPHGVRGFGGAPRVSGYSWVKDYGKSCSNEICVLVNAVLRGL